MAQTGTTIIKMYSSNTPGAAPLAANLAEGELAVNVTDKKLFTKDSTGAVVEIGQSGDVSFRTIHVGGPSDYVSNEAYGTGALASRSTSTGITAVGYQALNSLVVGNSNTAIGYQALKLATASSNTAVGTVALAALTTGGFNNAFGVSALGLCTTAQYNVAVGNDALKSCTTGGANVALGYNSLGNLTTGNGNLSLGGFNNPVFNVTTESNRIVMGAATITNAYVQVAWTVVSDARDKTNFAPVPHGLSFVMGLNPVAYQFRESRETDVATGPIRYGFKAQDVMPLEGKTTIVVDSEDPDKLRINETALIPILVNAIKELKAEFDNYRATHP